ncbi:MAG: transporter substrate-binding domain-containing protein, partial [Pseudomonadota bacterium]
SRSELVDFTQLTFVTGASLMTLKSSNLHDLTSLGGKKIGVVRNTTTVDALNALLKETLTDAKVIKVASASDGLDKLRKGEIDAFSSDQVVLIGLAATAEDIANFVISSEVFSFEPFALAVRRNDADFRLVADRVISHLYRTGQILPIYEQWFGRFAKERPPVFDALYQLNATPEG